MSVSVSKAIKKGRYFFEPLAKFNADTLHKIYYIIYISVQFLQLTVIHSIRNIPPRNKIKKMEYYFGNHLAMIKSNKKIEERKIL